MYIKWPMKFFSFFKIFNIRNRYILQQRKKQCVTAVKKWKNAKCKCNAYFNIFNKYVRTEFFINLVANITRYTIVLRYLCAVKKHQHQLLEAF